MNPPREPVVRRILVALDASPHSLAALEAAADMAVRLEAELLGLFVEDINLLRLAELPFAQEVGLHSGTRRELDRATMERALKVAAVRARDAMATVIGGRPVRWSFRVARGRVVAELLSAAVDADVLALGKAGAEFASRLGLGSTALGVLRQARCSVLLLPRGVRLRAPVVLVVGDGGSVSARAIEASAALAHACDHTLLVLIHAPEMELAHRLQTQLAEAFSMRKLTVHYRHLSGRGGGDLVRAVKAEAAGTLVMDIAPPVLGEVCFKALVAAIEGPLFLVQSSAR